MATPGFPTVDSTVAPLPSLFLASNFSAPFPTNEPWQNYVLNEGRAPELVLPYMVQLQPAAIAFGYSRASATSTSIIQAFIQDLLLSVMEGLPSPTIAAYDKLSVTFNWGAGLSVPLVRGSPYLTFVFNGFTPTFSTNHTVLSFVSNAEATKHVLKLSNEQTWLVYSSGPLPLSQSLAAATPFTGVIRVALLPAQKQAAAEAALDYHRSVYPTGGHFSVQHFQLSYRWRTASWGSLPASSLLLLTLPVHRASMQSSGSSGSSTCSPTSSSAQIPPATNISYETLDGPAVGHVGSKWVLTLPAMNISWYSAGGISDAVGLAAVREAVMQDVAALTPITGITSTYFFGKAAARAARLALIAEEVDLPDVVPRVRGFLRESLTPWFTGTVAGNALLYDSTWGGIVSQAGAAAADADFGLGLYNDHHFHYGYFVYAAATLTKLDSSWGRAYSAQIRALIADYLTLDSAPSPLFPVLRHFDPHALHSWASGLTEFADGRNQESSSEALNAYYAAALAGLALGDLPLASAAATLASAERRAARKLWHVPEGSSALYAQFAPEFARSNRAVGVLWATKRDAALWFAPATALAERAGIQTLPVTPVTAALFKDPEFARQLAEWGEGAPAGDAWRGFLCALRARADRQGALACVDALEEYDDGNSRANLLWWVYSNA